MAMVIALSVNIASGVNNFNLEVPLLQFLCTITTLTVAIIFISSGQELHLTRLVGHYEPVV
jgi:hypothetical protein